MRNDFKWHKFRPKRNPGVRIGNEGEYGRAGGGLQHPEAPDRLCWTVNSLPDALHPGHRGSLAISLSFPKLSLPVAMGTFMLRSWGPSLDLENKSIAQIGSSYFPGFRIERWYTAFPRPRPPPSWKVTVKRSTWPPQLWWRRPSTSCKLEINHRFGSKGC